MKTFRCLSHNAVGRGYTQSSVVRSYLSLSLLARALSYANRVLHVVKTLSLLSCRNDTDFVQTEFVKKSRFTKKLSNCQVSSAKSEESV